MGSFIHALTPGAKGRDGGYRVWGLWGERAFEPSSKVAFWEELHHELVRDAVLSPDSPAPSNKHRQHVTIAAMKASWIDGRWVPDESLADRLKRLRAPSGMSQAKFAEATGIPLGTLAAMESGVRGTNATWATLCAIARALEKPVTIFCGVEGFDPERQGPVGAK